MRFEISWGVLFGGCEGSGSRSKTSETHESHEMPMAKLDFDQLAFQYVEDGFPDGAGCIHVPGRHPDRRERGPGIPWDAQ